MWDGNISQNVAAPPIPVVVSIPEPGPQTDANVSAPPIIGYVSPPEVEVSAHSTVTPPPIAVIVGLDAPSGLSGSHIIDARSIEYGVTMVEDAIGSAVGGEFVDPIVFDVTMPAASVRGDAVVAGPTMVYYVEPAQQVQVDASVAVPTAPLTVDATTPAATPTASSAASADVMLVNASAVVPSVSASSTSDAAIITYDVTMPASTATGGGFSLQEMVKSGNWLPAFQGWYQLAKGWASDPSFPVVINADKLQVVGAGPANVEVSFTTSSSVDGLNSWTLFRGETIVGNITRPSGVTGTATLADGDLLSLRINAGSSGTLPLDTSTSSPPNPGMARPGFLITWRPGATPFLSTVLIYRGGASGVCDINLSFRG